MIAYGAQYNQSRASPSGTLNQEIEEGVAVTKVDQLKADIEKLPSEDFVHLCRWLRESGWERWDKQIEADSDSGALDFLIREATEEKVSGTLRDLSVGTGSGLSLCSIPRIGGFSARGCSRVRRIVRSFGFANVEEKGKT